MLTLMIADRRLQLAVGDITAQDTQAVVNAANSRLAPGGGVAGAIHRAAGPGLWAECARLGGCATGQAKLTAAYRLPNAYVIHTVGPVYSGQAADAELLRDCYVNALKLADRHAIRSIAFPALATGIFGYPLADAARVALAAIVAHLQGPTGLELVRLVLHDENAYAAHEKVLKEIQWT